MENFITVDYLSTFGGMVTIVVLITQFTKELVDKFAKGLPTKYVVFIYSLLTIIGFEVTSNIFDISKIFITIINAMLLTMTAMGGYECAIRPVEKKNQNKK
jgi:uncharacterized membrane protein YqhA